MSTKKRLAIGVCALLALTLLLSFGVVAFHGVHDCAATDCPVCLHICELSNLVRLLGFAAAALGMAVALMRLYVFIATPIPSCFSHETPVSLNVKLLN